MVFPMKTKKLRILLVDDNPDDRNLIVRSLKHDFPLLEVDEAIEYHGLERILERGEFDLVITDYHIRWTTGLEVLRLVKSHYPNCPVIMFTGTGNEEIAVQAMKSGLDDYIVKSPKHYGRISISIKSVLERTEQYREHQLAQEELRLREERFRRIINENMDAIFIISRTGVIRFVNPVGERLFDRKADELIGEQFEFPLSSSEPTEFNISRKDGRIAIAEMRVSEIHWEGEANYLATLRDITRRREAEEALRRSEAQLRQSQKMDSIGRLTGGVAHDFNNLLTSILGYSSLVMGRDDVDQSLREDLGEIQKAAKSSSALVRQLLAFSRKQVLALKVLEMNEVITGFEKLLRRIIGEDIEIVIRPGDHLKQVKVDPGQIEQVIMNLAVNARDAMPEGGRLIFQTHNVTIDKESSRTIPGAEPGDFVCLSVSDTGTGMDSETREMIFEPFFTTGKNGEGTGLGLSTVYGIVKQHGGWIHVYSEPGRGSVFKIYLPAYSLSVRKRPSEPVSGKELRGEGERILLVEDDKGVRFIAARTLRESGYVVFEAETARAARDIFERDDGDFKLILSDVVLPDQTGIDLVDELTSRNPDIPIMLCSGYLDDKSHISRINESGYSFLQKPYLPGELLEAVRQVLGEGEESEA